MSEKPILLLLHGVGAGPNREEWVGALESALNELGYPDLAGATVIAPKYAHALRDTDDDDEKIPGFTAKAPFGEDPRKNRREFERHMGAVEQRLGRHNRGAGWAGGDTIAEAALAQPFFAQASNYLTKPQIRAQVLGRVLKALPSSGRLVIVGHSLGSVIAADLVRRLPSGLTVVGMVTVGSPLAHPKFADGWLRDTLKEPPVGLGWWVNFWNAADPVTTRQGISSVFPWMVDFRVPTVVGSKCHNAEMYLSCPAVAEAIGFALFGSLSKELVLASRDVDVPLDYPETVAVMALRYAHLIASRLKAEDRDRYLGALRQVQAETVERLTGRNERENRPIPTEVARLLCDLSDSESLVPEPRPISHLSKDDAVVPLLSIVAANVVFPFEITVPKGVLEEAVEELTAEMWLGGQMGTDVFAAAGEAQRVLAGPSQLSWIKWVAVGVGAAAIVVATAGLALAAAPGVAGAAAITSALAAFGPGGMIGGLLTAGTLVTAGGGGVAFGLASPAATVEAVEAVVWGQLAAAILRHRQGLAQDPMLWFSLTESAAEVRRERARLEAFSERSAPTLKALQRKLQMIDRALAYLREQGLVPSAALLGAAKPGDDPSYASANER